MIRVEITVSKTKILCGIVIIASTYGSKNRDDSKLGCLSLESDNLME